MIISNPDDLFSLFHFFETSEDYAFANTFLLKGTSRSVETDVDTHAHVR